MAKMTGDLIWHRDCRDCCGEKTTKSALKRQEERQWRGEFVDEVIEEGEYYHWQLGGRS